MLAGLAAVALAAERVAADGAVVVVAGAETTLRQGNGVNYPAALARTLPPGLELRRLGERGDWLHVELGDGTVGWLPHTAVLALRE